MPLPAPTTYSNLRSQIGTVNTASSRAQPLHAPAPTNKAEMSTSDAPHSVTRPLLGRPLSFQNEAEGAKRRSLLPQLGQPRYSTRSNTLSGAVERSPERKEPVVETTESSELPDAVSVKQEVNVQNAMPGRLRPRSMYQTVTASEKTTASRSMRPPASVSKRSDPQTVGLGRSHSLRKPGVPAQSTQSTGGAGHSRAQSGSNIATTRRDPAKSKPSSERPKSLIMAPNSGVKTSGASADTVPSGTRTSVRLAGLNRSASTKTRPEVSSGGANTGAPSRLEEPHVTLSRRKETVAEEPKKTHRPAFSTLQQHFTPRKGSKAPTTAFLHPAPAPATHSLPPEIVNLQSELLQLHLLHQASTDVNRSWELSAKRSLHMKFDEVASLHQVMLEYERAGQEQKNLQSLLEWSSGRPSAGLVEHIQVLSEPLHELPSLVEPGGRLHRLVAEFEQWMTWVQEIRSARQNPTGNQAALGTIEGLGDLWKAENAALTRKLSSFARDLDGLDQPEPGSSIACIVDSCTSLLRGVLQELHTMRSIEVDVVTKEKDWVEDRLKAIARDIGTCLVDTDGQTAAWRV